MGSLHSWNLKLFFVVSGENLVPNRKPNFQMLSVQRPRSVSPCYFILKRVARPSRCEVVVHAHDLMAFCKQPPTNVRAWIGQVWCVLHPLTQTQCRVIYHLPYSTTDLDVGLESLRHQWQVCAWIARCWRYPWKLNSVYSKPQYSWIRLHKVTNLSRYNPGSNLCQHYARTM